MLEEYQRRIQTSTGRIMENAAFREGLLSSGLDAAVLKLKASSHYDGKVLPARRPISPPLGSQGIVKHMDDRELARETKSV